MILLPTTREYRNLPHHDVDIYNIMAASPRLPPRPRRRVETAASGIPGEVCQGSVLKGAFGPARASTAGKAIEPAIRQRRSGASIVWLARPHGRDPMTGRSVR